MKKHDTVISNPDDLNKHLQNTSPLTWIILSLSICGLVVFFAWSCIYKVQDKISGIANIKNGEATLVIDASNKNKLAVGQKVYISEQVREIISINDSQPVISSFDLDDGEYTYIVVIKEIRPIDFLIK